MQAPFRTYACIDFMYVSMHAHMHTCIHVYQVNKVFHDMRIRACEPTYIHTYMHAGQQVLLLHEEQGQRHVR